MVVIKGFKVHFAWQVCSRTWINKFIKKNEKRKRLLLRSLEPREEVLRGCFYTNTQWAQFHPKCTWRVAPMPSVEPGDAACPPVSRTLPGPDTESQPLTQVPCLSGPSHVWQVPQPLIPEPDPPSCWWKVWSPEGREAVS